MKKDGVKEPAETDRLYIVRERVEKSVRFQRNTDGVRSRADISGLFSKREEPAEVVGGACFLRLVPVMAVYWERCLLRRKVATWKAVVIEGQEHTK